MGNQTYSGLASQVHAPAVTFEMTRLFRANSFEGTLERCVNPVWAHIGHGVEETLLKRFVGMDAAEGLYVEERIGPSVSELQVKQWIRNGEDRALVVQGLPGAGKTTLLRRAIASIAQGESITPVWVDLERSIAEGLPEEQFANAVMQEMVRQISVRTADRTDRNRWFEFLARTLPDPTGELSVLRDEVFEVGWGRRQARVVLQQARVLIINPLLAFRYWVRCHDEVWGQRVVVIIDNCDLIPVSHIARVLRIATQISEGDRSHFSPSLIDARGNLDRATAIVTMRPTSIQAVGDTSLSFARREYLAAPNIEMVLKRRVEVFLERYGTAMFGRSKLRQPTTSDIEGDAVVRRELDVESDRQWVRRCLKTLGASSRIKRWSLVELAQRMANWNTRTVLIAVAQYLASGHLSATVFEAEDARGGHRKCLGALILGMQASFSSADSELAWVCNLFNDGYRDQLSSIVQLRILSMLPKHESGVGLKGGVLATRLAEMLDYPEDRVMAAVVRLQRFALVRENDSGAYSLTTAGEVYFGELLSNFEYLQHMVPDAWVEGKYLVRPDAHDIRARRNSRGGPRQEEGARVRFERVLLFGQWLRSIEERELGAAVVRGHGARFVATFGDQAFSQQLAAVLRSAWDYLPKRNTPAKWEEMRSATNRLAQNLTGLASTG